MKGKKGVTVLMDMTELLIAALCIIAGLLLLFGLGKMVIMDKENYGVSTANVIQAEREQITLVRSTYVDIDGIKLNTIGDVIILAESSKAYADALQRQEVFGQLQKNNDFPDRIILPTYDGKIVGIGGKISGKETEDRPSGAKVDYR